MEAYRELTKRGVRKVSAEQLKAMLHGKTMRQEETQEGIPFLSTQEEKIEKEAIGSLDTITALMGSAHKENTMYNNI